ncbi:MAG: putative sugar O-methyltransferase [Nitrospirae bacterium]|nr:putative sugar O-methyltransferase [Nitrospirota bacterium]
MNRLQFKEQIERYKQESWWHNYLHVRDHIFYLLEEEQKQSNRPSNYWEEELAGFDYMFDASPLIIQKLREHCYHLTGLRAYDYREHHAHQIESFKKKLNALREQDANGLLVPESPLLGGFGYLIDDMLINLDTLKFYESFLALNKAGLLAPLRQNVGDKKVIIEIGAGWGGFAYQFKSLFPNTCYIIVDLPQTILFSGVYLKTLFPDASVLFYGDKPVESLLDEYNNYDIIFLPHFFFSAIKTTKIDLAINIASFQEMTGEQVDSYIRCLAELKCPNIYSHNRDRSKHNRQLTTVSSILSGYYNVTEQRVLDVPYTDLVVPMTTTKTLTQKILWKSDTNRKRLIYEYRHLIGTLSK